MHTVKCDLSSKCIYMGYWAEHAGEKLRKYNCNQYKTSKLSGIHVTRPCTVTTRF